MRLFERGYTNEDANTNERASDAERTNQHEKLPYPVYYIESADDDTVLIGIGVSVNHNKIGEESTAIIRWYDTNHERAMTASEIVQEDNIFTFKRVEQEGGGRYHFTPMNLEIYNSKVKRRLINGSDFTNDEDLIKAFLSTTEY